MSMYGGDYGAGYGGGYDGRFAGGHGDGYGGGYGGGYGDRYGDRYGGGYGGRHGDGYGDGYSNYNGENVPQSAYNTFDQNQSHYSDGNSSSGGFSIIKKVLSGFFEDFIPKLAEAIGESLTV